MRLLKFAFGLDHLDAYDTDPPTLYEQLDELFAVVADEESRWRRNLGSRRR
ncbi:MAG TPA: hypothetical protein VFR33_08340 [Candidatus Dormibacteraeota bacterium]|nr:hypothetical protein [Candidatus Dormibacteraeota bacterium]